MKDEKAVVPNPDLVPFDSVEAARDPHVQTELLRMAAEDGRSSIMAHARRMIDLAQER